MALDFTSKVIALFKADTSDMEAGLKKLTGEEKKHQRAILDSAKERNASYDSWVAKLGNANQALELVGRGVAFARESFKAYSEDLRLRAAAGTVSIDKLKSASLGLRTEQELMAFAAKAQHGVFKVTETQMATVQRAMVALTRAGFDQEAVTNKLTESLVKGKAEGLDDFGISVRKGTTDAENFKNMMDALAQKASGVKDGTLTGAEGVEKMGVTMQESIDKMKVAIGELVAAMAPLLNALARGVAAIADVVATASGGIDFKGAFSDPKGYIERINKLGNSPGGYAALIAASKGDMDGAEKIIAAQQAIMGTGGAPADAFGETLGMGSFDQKAFAAWLKNASKGKTAKGKPAPGAFSDYARAAGTDTAGAPIGFSTSLGSAADATQYDMYGRESSVDTTAILEERQKALTDDWHKRLADQKAKGAAHESKLAGLFGPVGEFDVYKAAFEGLSAAVGSTYEAIVTGSGSASAAFKKMIADSIMGIGKRSAIEALKEGAYAIASLAMYNYPAAALHAKAAAGHAAVAIAAGVAARGMGAGQSLPTSGSAASDTAAGGTRTGGGGGSSGGGSDSLRPIVMIVGEHFGSMSVRQRRQEAEETMARALRERDE